MSKIFGVHAKLASTDWEDVPASVINGANQVGFGTMIISSAKSRRVGSDGEIIYVLKSGTVTGSIAQLPLPAGWVTSSAIIPDITATFRADGAVPVGRVDRGAVTGGFDVTVIAAPGLAYLGVGVAHGTAIAMVRAAANAVVVSNEFFTVTAKIPIQGWSSNDILPIT